jgi:transposase, IS30 family
VLIEKLGNVSRGRPLCIEERELILRGIAQDEPFRLIGLRLGRNPSVISREGARNGGRGAYSVPAAQDRADAARRRVWARNWSRCLGVTVGLG